MPDREQPQQPTLSGDALAHLEETIQQVQAELSSLVEPIRRSAQLTEADYSIRINARA
jgi:hypothetical protein